MTERKCFVFRFADLEVSERELSVTRDGVALALEPKAFRVLLFFLHRPNGLVTKDELLTHVWADVSVSENSLARAVAQIRRILGDDFRRPRFIATVSTVGYRFICPVAVTVDPSPGLEIEKEPVTEVLPKTVAARSIAAMRSLRYARYKWWLMLLVVVPAAGWYLHRPLPAPRIGEYKRLTLDGRKKLPIGSDGKRLYLNLYDGPGAVEVPVSGGQILPALPQFNSLADLSPDGASFLAFSPSEADPKLSVVSAQGSVSRYLTKACNAAWAPDGKTVIYNTCNGDIYQISSEGGEPHLLLAAKAPAGKRVLTGNAQLSPDGRTIRFDRDHTIWEVSADGGNLHKFLPDWRPRLFKCCGHWTRDGAFFLFISGESAEEGPNFNPGAKLWAVDERRRWLQQTISTPTQLTSGPTVWDSPVLSQDGRTIFVRNESLRGELVRYKGASGAFEPYLGGQSSEFVSFSKDGQSVAFVSFPDGILWRAHRDGSGQVQLTKPPFHPKNPRWSPDGTEILFLDDSPANVESAYTVSSAGGTPARMLAESNGPQGDADWSPDGSRVVFSSSAQFSSGPVGATEIRIFDRVSHAITKIPGSEGLESPRWSPDGRHIAALNYDVELMVFDLDTGHWTGLRKGKVDFPTFSHDGRYVYFMALFDRAVYRVAVSGGVAERVVDLKDFRFTGWFTFWMGLDPTDAPLLLRDQGTDEIYALTLER